MRPVIQRTGALRRRIHRQYVPIPAPPVHEPGLYPGEPEACRRDSRAVPADPGAPRAACWASSRSSASRAAPSSCSWRSRWPRCRSTTCSPIAGRSRSSWPSRSPGWPGSSAPSTAAYVLGSRAVLIGVCYLPVAWAAAGRKRRRVRRAVIALVWTARLAGAYPKASGPCSPRCSCSG